MPPREGWISTSVMIPSKEHFCCAIAQISPIGRTMEKLLVLPQQTLCSFFDQQYNSSTLSKVKRRKHGENCLQNSKTDYS